jgi:hypothetical protein
MTVSGKLRGIGGGGSIENAVLLASDATYAMQMRYGSGWWSDDGTHLYASTWGEEGHHFSSDLDLTSLALQDTYTWSSKDIMGTVMKPDGAIAMIFDDGRDLRGLNPSTPFDLYPAGTRVTTDLRTAENGSYALRGGTASRSGDYLFTLSGAREILRYSLTAAFDPLTLVAQTADVGQVLDLSVGPSGPIDTIFGVCISHDGTLLHVGERSTNAIFQWKLSTPHDLTTAVFVGEFFDAVNLSAIGGVAAHPSDKTIIYGLSQHTGITKWRVA